MQQRWANNSVFEYYSNTWGRILVFIFVIGWLFETKYYSYSGDFLKPNVIHICNFSNQIPLGFLFEHYIYFSKHCYYWWGKKSWRWQYICQKSESKGKHDVLTKPFTFSLSLFWFGFCHLQPRLSKSNHPATACYMPQMEWNINTVMFIFLLSTAQKGPPEISIHIWSFWHDK